ncbi:MAG: DUF1579 domain-containing protein [Bacteroidetes bacterium]|nr:DUF1579 domain-containing protein [Bacteroidota bacterium]
MKKTAQLFLAFIILAAALNVFAQSAEDQKAWMEYMTPGKVHEMFAKNDGVWEGENTFWMAPGAPEMKTKSEATYSMIMGGRYQLGKYTGDMMGMPFEGMGIVGYDNALNEVFSFWIDNFGTGMMTTKGKWDEATKSANMMGTMVDPMTAKEEPIREVYTVMDENTNKLEMYHVKDGTEYKAMEIIFKRK